MSDLFHQHISQLVTITYFEFSQHCKCTAPWTVAFQIPLFVEFSKQGGCLLQWIFLTQGSNLCFLRFYIGRWILHHCTTRLPKKLCHSSLNFFCLVLFWVSFDTNIFSPLEMQISWSQNQIRFCRTPQAVSKKEGKKRKLRAVCQEIRGSLKETSHSPHCNLLTVCWQKVPGRSLWISVFVFCFFLNNLMNFFLLSMQYTFMKGTVKFPYRQT